jgi:hypothetical protein
MGQFTRGYPVSSHFEAKATSRADLKQGNLSNRANAKQHPIESHAKSPLLIFVDMIQSSLYSHKKIPTTWIISLREFLPGY